MIHLEEMERRWPDLRISRSVARKIGKVMVSGSPEDRIRALNSAFQPWGEKFSSIFQHEIGFREQANRDIDKYSKAMGLNLLTLMRYVAEGERVFSLSKSLVEILLDIPINEVEPEDFALPFSMGLSPNDQKEVDFSPRNVA